MRLKMLIGMSGSGFVLDPGDVTERFADAEANRLIASGYAEKAAPIVKPKPATKQEWDDERDALIIENKRLTAEALLSSEREAALLLERDKLIVFKNLVAEGLQELMPVERLVSDTAHGGLQPVGKADVV